MPSGVIATLLHAKAAVITARTSRIAVLPTVPFRVIAPPAARETTVPLPRSRKVESFRAGLPLRMGCVLARVCLFRPDMRIQGKRFQGRCKVNDCAAPNRLVGWCERGDSNPHALRHRHLKPGRLPVPPLSRYPRANGAARILRVGSGSGAKSLYGLRWVAVPCRPGDAFRSEVGRAHV